MKLFLSVWRALEGRLGPIPHPPLGQFVDSRAVVSAATAELTPVERLVILGDILSHIARWRDARSVLSKALTFHCTPHECFRIHNKLGLCAKLLSSWKEAFHHFALCLEAKGLPDSFESLLGPTTNDDPELAPLYGNVGDLLTKVGRPHDSVICHEQDAKLCERFHLPGISAAYANLSVAYAEVGNVDAATAAADSAATWARTKGDIIALATAHGVAARLATTRGDWAQTDSLLQAALYIYDVVGKPDGQIAVLKEFAQHCYSLGEFSKGHQYHARALGLAESYDTTDLLSPA